MTTAIALLLLACAEKPKPAVEEPPVPDVAPVEAPAPTPAVEASATEAPATTDAPAPPPEAPAAPTTTATPAHTTAPTSTAPATESAAPTTTPTEPAATAPVVATPAAPVRYTLDPSGSLLYVQVFKDTTTAASDLSHDHVMLASGWTGTATWSVDDPTACNVAITVPVGSLRVDPPDMRKKVGYDNVLSDSQRDQVKEHMLDKSQLDGDKFSDIRFESTSCAAAGDKVKVTGKLTLHGVTKTVAPTLTIAVKDGTFAASGTLKIKGSDYGVEPYSAMLGALKNLDEMKLTVNVRGTTP